MQDNDFQLDLFGSSEPVLEPSKKNDVRWVLYTDGASRRNPGPSSAGIYVMKNDKPFLKKGFFLGTKTNNQAEYLALIIGIYYAKQQMVVGDTLCIISDSELLIRQMKGIYRVKNDDLRHLFECAKKMLQGVKHSLRHVLREYNTVADELANDGLDNKVALEPELLSFLQSHDIRI